MIDSFVAEEKDSFVADNITPKDNLVLGMINATIDEFKDIPAQIQDLLTIPARLLGTPRPPLVSRLITETVPDLVEKAVTPIGDFTIPTLSYENIKGLFREGKLRYTASDISPTPFDIAWYGILGGVLAKNEISLARWNMHLDKLIRTEEVRGTVMNNMPAFENLATQVGIRLPEDLSLEAKTDFVLSQAKNSPKLGSAIMDLVRGKIVARPTTVPPSAIEVPTPGIIPAERPPMAFPEVPKVSAIEPIPLLNYKITQPDEEGNFIISGKTDLAGDVYAQLIKIDARRPMPSMEGDLEIKPKSVYVEMIESHSPGAGRQLIESLKQKYDHIYMDAYSKEGAALAKDVGFKMTTPPLKAEPGQITYGAIHGGWEWHKEIAAPTGEVIALPEEVSIKKGRLAQLEIEIKSVDDQMSLLEEQKARFEKLGKSTGAIDTKLETLGTRYNYIDSQIAEILTGAPVLAKEKISIRAGELVRRIEQGIKEGTLRTKEEIAGIQTEITNLVKEAKLEPKDEARLLRTMKSVQTQAQLEKVIPRITEIKEKSERVELVKDLRGLFRKQPTKNLPIEYKDLIESIKSKFLLKELTEKAKARLESMRQFVERMKEEGTEINIPQEKLDLLEKVSADKMTTQELRDLKEVITRLYHQGKLKNKLLTALQERKFDDIKAEIINIITQGKGLNEDSSIVKALREQNKSLKDKGLEHIKNYIIENMRPELMLNILDGGAPGLITNVLFNPLWESQKAELQEGQKVSDTIKDIHKNLNLAEIFTKKFKIGRFEGMTKDTAMFIYANSFNDANMLHLTGSGITNEDITAITNFLSAEEKQAVKNMIRFYDEYQYPILDKIFSELEGVHLGKERQYFPIDRLEDVSYNKELEKDILERNYVRRPGVSKGFTKERVSSVKGFSDFSYFGTVLRNYRKVEHYKAFAKSVRDANKILNNPEIRTSIKEKLGDKYHRVLDKWLKDVAYGADKQSMASIDKMCQWLRTNYAIAVIGGNLLSVMKAPISYVQGMEMAGKWNTIKATFEFILSPLGWNEKIDDKSILMKFRPMRQERELNEIVAQRTLKQQIGRVTGYQAIREGSMLPWVIADKATCDIVWMAAYRGALSDGMTELQAINYADMVIRRTQPMSGALNLPDTFRGPEYQKLFTLFRNQQNQNFNLLLESILQKQKGKTSNTAFMSHLVFYLLVPAVMIGAISRKRLPEDWGEFAKDTLNGALGGLIYLGNITSLLATGFMGTTTPLDSLYEDVYKTVQAKDNWKKLDHLANMISKVAGFPYLAVKRIITGKPLGEPTKTKKKGLEPI